MQTVAVVGYAAAGIGGGVLAAAVAFAPSFAFVLAGGRYFDRLRANAGVQAFLTGAGPAAIGAIAGAAVPLALSLDHLWQAAVLAVAAAWLLGLRRGVVTAIVGRGRARRDHVPGGRTGDLTAHSAPLRRRGGGSMLGRMPRTTKSQRATGCSGRDYGEVLWEPSPEVIRRARITGYRRWLAERGTRPGPGSPPAGSARPPRPATTTSCGSGRWTSRRPSGTRCGTTSTCLGERGDGPVLTGGQMPDVTWFPGATLNYARNALRTALDRARPGSR